MSTNSFILTVEIQKFNCSRHENSHISKRHEIKTKEFEILEDVHESEKPYSCQFCDKKFRVQSIMKVHEKRCEIKPNEKYFDINFMLHSATERKLENKSLKSKELNKEKSKITKIENELLVSDNSGKKHSKNTEGSKNLKDSPKDRKDDPKNFKHDSKDLKYDPKDLKDDPKDLEDDP